MNKSNYSGVEEKNDMSNVLRVLKEVKELIEKKDYSNLSGLSNETIHSAAVNQDSLNIVVAVLIYSLYKVFQREHYRNLEGWDRFYGALIKNLDLMILNARKNDSKKVLDHAGKIRHSLNDISGDLGIYVKDVFRKAEINKAFKLYEHGISSEKTAELLGVSLWDLASYIGQSTISEAHVGINIHEKVRVKYVEDFFK